MKTRFQFIILVILIISVITGTYFVKFFINEDKEWRSHMNFANPKVVILERLKSIIEIDSTSYENVTSDTKEVWKDRYNMLKDGINNLIEDIEE